ncbi:MAG TPA: tRNA (N(6)-L-threonylcarbamoyladenosine(37)-C(2))-methylthiotransferase MtaB, partial [Candidatus Hydrogenedentes bacterium]|nr:tRNA (N(6)-L-threonylcarbamoyladenosine(37)-C(2))-methylthiotransferase MtaB [Candidatus Hydrogenedentota bacterium]
DILVGFPGETDADFEKTCMLFEESPCFYAHVFKYSEREGAAASRMPHAVDPSAAGRRSARVRRISAIKERAFLDRYAGRAMEVLFEHREGGCWTGYTENYLRVAVESEADLTNRLLPVRLTAVRGDVMIGTVEDKESQVVAAV